MDIVNIARGILNATKNEFGVGDPEVEKKAEERVKVCLTCLTLSSNRQWCQKDRGGCGCKIGWLVRSKKVCINGKWS
jgi:hypothetical protein